MLIVCNGAFKSGSTWIESIVRKLIQTNDFPVEYRDKNLNRCLDINKIKEFIEEPLSGNYVTKAHEKNPNTLFVKNSKNMMPKVIMISRDPRDVLVSYYFHFINSTRMTLSFNLFYLILGRFKLCEISRYNSKWRMMPESDVLWLSYEAMTVSVSTQLDVIAEYIGVNLDEYNRKKIIEETSINKLKMNSNNPDFFRSGVVGDWINYVNLNLAKKIIKEDEKFPLWVRLVSIIIFDFRRIATRNITFFRGV